MADELDALIDSFAPGKVSPTGGDPLDDQIDAALPPPRARGNRALQMDAQAGAAANDPRMWRVDPRVGAHEVQTPGAGAEHTPQNASELMQAMRASGLRPAPTSITDAKHAKLAHMGAVGYLQRHGLDLEDVSPELYKELVGAHRFTNEYIYAPPSVDEAPEIITRSLQRVVGKVLQAATARLNQAEPDERGRIARPFKDALTQRQWAQTAQFSQFLIDNASSAEVRDKWASALRWTARARADTQGPGSEEGVTAELLADAADLFAAPGAHEPIPDDLVISSQRARFPVFQNYIPNLLAFAFDNTEEVGEPEQVLFASLDNSIQDLRYQRLGLPEDASRDQILATTHPNIVATLAERYAMKTATGRVQDLGPDASDRARIDTFQREFAKSADGIVAQMFLDQQRLTEDERNREVGPNEAAGPWNNLAMTTFEAFGALEGLLEAGAKKIPGAASWLFDVHQFQTRKLQQAYAQADNRYFSATGYNPEALNDAVLRINRGEKLSFGERMALLGPERGLGHGVALWMFGDLPEEKIREAAEYGLPPEVARARFTEAAKVLVRGADFTGFSPDEVGEALADTTVAQREFMAGRQPIDEYARSVFRGAITMVGNAYQEMLVGTTTNAERVAAEMTANTLGAVAYSRTISPLLDSVKNTIAKSFRARRIGRDIARAAAVDADTFAKMRAFSDGLIKDGAPADSVLEQLANVSAKIAAKHDQLLTSGASANLRLETAELGRALSRLDGGDLTNMAKHLDVDLVSLRLGNVLNPTQVISEGIRRMRERFGLMGVRAPEWLSKNTQLVATEIVEAINQGTQPPVMRILSEAQANSAPALAKQKMVSWIANFQEKLMELRALNSGVRDRQVSFMEHVVHTEGGRLHDLEGAGNFTADEKFLREVVEPQFQIVRRARAQGEQLANRDWSRVTNLTQTESFQTADPHTVIMWAQQHLNDGEFYSALRGWGETPDMTFARVRKTMAEYLADPTDEKFVVRAVRLKDRLGAEFLDAPGVSGKAHFSDGRALTRGEAKRLRREARTRARVEERLGDLSLEEEAAIRKTLDRLKRADAMRQGFEEVIESADMPEAWKQIMRSSAVERSAQGLKNSVAKEYHQAAQALASTDPGSPEFKKLQRRLDILNEKLDDEHNLLINQLGIRAFDLEDGNFASSLKRLENLSLEMKITQHARADQVAKFWERYKRATPEERELFDAAVVAQDDLGLRLPMSQLRQNAPVRFLGLDETPDGQVQSLLDDVESFRHGLLKDMISAGMVDKASFEKLAGPYAPRLYQTYVVDGLEVGVPRAKGTGVSTLRRLNLSEFKLRKHPELFTATVNIKGSGWTTRTFDTAESAQRWVKNTYGVRGKVRGRHRLRGQTEFGDKFEIHPPLGGDVAKVLNPLPRGASLLARLDDLVTDVAIGQFLGMLDRPFGSPLVLSQLEYNAQISKKGATEADVADFIRIDEARKGGGKFGPLAGKFVHKDLITSFRIFTDSHLLAKKIARDAQETASSFRLFDRALTGMRRFAYNGMAFSKELIVSNAITRSLSTVLNNLIGDNFMYARAVTPDLWTSRGGWQSLSKAVKVLFGDPIKNQTDPANAALIRTMVEAGALDETIADLSIQRTLRTPLIELLLGERAGAKDRISLTFKNLAETFGGERGVTLLEKLVGALPDDPQLVRVAQRHAEVEKFIASSKFGEISPKLQQKLAAEKVFLSEQLRNSEPGVMKGAMRAIKRLGALSLGRAGGRFGETEDVFKWLYGRLNNVTRLAVQLHLMENKGLGFDDAMEKVRGAMQTYSRVPTALRDFSKSPFGAPIISYAYEHARILGWHATNNVPGLLGILSGYAAVNFTTLAASGVDPYQTMAQLRSVDPNVPWWAQMSRRLLYNHGDGFGVVGPTGADPFAPGLLGGGLISKFFDDDLANKPFIEQVMGMGKGYLQNTVLSNPMFVSMASLVTGRSPRTGDLAESQTSLVGENMTSWARLAVPPWFPLGRNAQVISESQRRAPRVITGRKVALANAVLRAHFGIEAKGVNLPFSSVLAKPLATLAGADLLGVPLRQIPEKEIGESDVVSFIYQSSAAFDPDNETEVQKIFGTFQSELRSAAWFEGQEDPGMKEFGKRWLGQLTQRLARMRSAEATLELGERPPEDMVRALRNVYRQGDMEKYFEGLSVVRKADVVRKLHELTENDKLVQDHVTWTIFSASGAGREPTSVVQIEDAMKLLENYLSAATRREGLEQIEFMHAWLQSRLPKAETRLFREGFTDQERARAIETMEGVR